MTKEWQILKLPDDLGDETKRRGPFRAPDGSQVLALLGLDGGSAAHFRLDGGVSVAVAHRTVDEFWYFLAGTGEMWLKRPGGRGRDIAVERGVLISIPAGTEFQFRVSQHSEEPLCALGITMPPWPLGSNEAYRVLGRWKATVEPSKDLYIDHPAFRVIDGKRPIVEVMKKRFGRMAVYLNNEDSPTEAVCVEEESPARSVAVAAFTRIIPHKHKRTRETYEVISGDVQVSLNGDVVSLASNTPLVIEPGVVHNAWSLGPEIAWIRCVSEPPWSSSDHFFEVKTC